MNYLIRIEQEEIRSRLSLRAGETKLGEVLKVGFEGSRYVILGVPEAIGVKANWGRGGTESLWPAFLDAFVNIQSTVEFAGDEVAVLGYFDFSLLEPEKDASLDEWRQAVLEIDRAVSEVVKEIIAHEKTPIIIGGGHNNCYPIIKGVAEGLYMLGKLTAPQLNVVNLDAHADFRALEGRHSGNGFRYAYQEGFIGKYAVVGLSKNYNSQKMLEELMSMEEVKLCFWEEIFLEGKMTFGQAMEETFDFIRGDSLGIELDMDAIEKVLSSALSPVGISATQSRQYVHFFGSKKEVAYLHLCEGAVKMEGGLCDETTGKLVSYLVSDFIRANRG
ncbi:formimidoylglutamase [Echinicola sediminis]